MASNMRAVARKLGSDKLKDRQEGIAAIRSTFSNDAAVRNFCTVDGVVNPNLWLGVFQELFQALRFEVEAYNKKLTSKAASSGNAILRRISDTASTIRWLVERTVDMLNRKVTNALFTHLTDMLVQKRELFLPVALDYIKTIKCLVSYRPHMDHRPTHWVDIVQLAFNVILNDPVNMPLENLSRDADSQGPMSPGSGGHSDSEFYAEGSDDDGAEASTSNSKKRRARAPTRSPTKSRARPANKRYARQVSVSLEQVEFASLLTVMLDVELSSMFHEDSWLPSSIMDRLGRFLQIYPPDTSLLHDYLMSLFSVLSHMSLNNKRDIEIFAKGSWNDLINLWGTKNKRMKECLVAILRILFPFLISDQDEDDQGTFNLAEAVGKLWRLLDVEAEGKWSVESLSLDSLRLVGSGVEATESQQDLAFSARTFRSGPNFDPGQCLAWAILELQADCVGKLFELSESMHPSMQGSSRNETKRTRMESPISTLLSLIQKPTTVVVRAYRLQVLLFSIDKHWRLLHSALRREVVDVLLQLVTFDDGLIQSWIFMCFAAIAYAESRSSAPSEVRDAVVWDPIWAHAIRRANVPPVCRAACHAAYFLLISSNSSGNKGGLPLTYQKVLLEIETLAKDLDVQGPTYPYDSVCVFLAQCLKIAAQDVRLYRMQLEDKVLNWLTDSWKTGGMGSRGDIPLNAVSDILLLLETVCALSKRSRLMSRILLPQCQIAETIIEQASTKVIRDFLLFAHLPDFRPQHENQTRERTMSWSDNDLPSRTSQRSPTAESARRSLDVTVVALSFESLLVLNGTCANRRVLQLISSLLIDSRWTTAEKALILHGLEPLIKYEEDRTDEYWEAMLPPSIGTGIMTQTLHQLAADDASHARMARRDRMSLLRILWQRGDVQSSFNTVIETLRLTLHSIIGPGSNPQQHEEAGGDGFGPIRTATNLNSPESNKPLAADLCIALLATAPLLQTAAGEPTRDNQLMELIVGSAEDHGPEIFSLLLSICLDQVRQGTLSLTSANLESILDTIPDWLPAYAYSRSFLDSTMEIWSAAGTTSAVVVNRAQKLYIWLAGLFSGKNFNSWKVRDSMARFFDKFISMDPHQRALISGANSIPQDTLPIQLLPTLGSDEDIRVRFRVAVLAARLFSTTTSAGISPVLLYRSIIDGQTRDTNEYERLGNVMVVSSATCLHSPLYSRHIEAILVAVSQRMGLANLSGLCQAYASQLAFSISQAGSDILRFPPHLLGYRDRRACAEATFRAFTPTNILTNHCKVIQKRGSDGILASYYVDENSTANLEEILREGTIQDEGDFEACFSQNVDGIVSSMLRAHGEQDFSMTGPIVQALQSLDNAKTHVKIFQALTKYRTSENFEVHSPNLPALPTMAIIRSLQWLDKRPNAPQSTFITYHLLHLLFADIKRSSLINEQIRLINGLSIWIALHYDDFEDPVLLHTLIHGATSLLAYWDIAQSAQSLLEWAFEGYKQLEIKDPHFPDVLIRICSTAHDYASNPSNGTIRELGKILLRWIDDQAMKISELSIFRSQVLRALPAWPHSPNASLAELNSSIQPDHISSLLTSSRNNVHKFRLVRRLRDYAMSQKYDDSCFSNDFWHLKNSIPPTSKLQHDDIDAFASLLVLTKGQINSFGGEQASSSTQEKAKVGDESLHAPVITKLLALLEADSSVVYAAYETLRLIMSSLGSHSSGLSQHRAELRYLQMFPRMPKPPSGRNLNDTLNSETYYTSAVDFPKWIVMVSTLFSDTLSLRDPFYAQLTSIIQADIVFAEDILPTLVHTILQAERGNAKTSQDKIGGSRNTLSTYFTHLLSLDNINVSCRRSIINIVLHLRTCRSGSTDKLAYNKWLDVDFMLLAKSAIVCGAYTTSLLFLELAAESQTSPVLEDEAAEEILYEIYGHIDEPDGFYGIKTKDLDRFLVKRFHHEKQWEKAYRRAEGLLKSFHFFGFDRLAINTLQGFSDMPASITTSPSMSYRLGWRTETWDLPDRQENSSGASLYIALRAIHRERDPNVIDHIVRSALSKEMAHLRDLGPENLTEIREVTRDLMCLSQISHWRHSSVQKALLSKHLDSSQWSDFVRLDTGFDFPDLENIMATRVSLIRSVRRKEQRQQIGNLATPFIKSLTAMEKSCLVRLSEAARDSHQFQVALNSIIRAQKLDKLASFEVSQEFASVLWLQKEEKLAVQFLSSLLLGPQDPTCDNIDALTKALLLARLGSWSSEACLEKPTDIWTRFFVPSISLLEDAGLADDKKSQINHAIIYQECARFAERQYHATLKSHDVIRQKIYVQRGIATIKQREEKMKTVSQALLKEHKKALSNARTQLNEDNERYQKHIVACDKFLQEAIRMYSQSLEASDTFDSDATIRLCSLWFANFDRQPLQMLVRTALKRIPSRKFVFLSHQLSARLAKSQQGEVLLNQENLHALVIRMCREHPFHSLYQVYCLLPDRPPSTPSQHRQSGRHLVLSMPTERGTAAVEIFDKLRDEPDCGSRLRDVENLCNACLQWAKYPIKEDPRFKRKSGSSSSSKKPFLVPGDIAILKIQNPKVPISVCKGVDGESYKQLFKGEGNDDMRQDAVMEQVFELVNNVLHGDLETRRRALGVRDYKVIPLGAQAGLLEFVSNTRPLGSWLHEAHRKYRPTDILSRDLDQQLQTAQKEFSTEPDLLVARFQKLRESFRPVMRHYFTEQHKTPISWFAMRLNYTRSVATTSIVGHVLGLGDRHVSNILLDDSTGQVVHIDLGIAFDQGKLLPIPELVPFRMTADMVDGMGITGTQGVFQRCAEETLRVLREGSEVIMTVLEVFKYDPLHSWTASDVKLKGVQKSSGETERFGVDIGIDMSSGTAEEAADRALSSVSRKLDKSLSVECTVNELIAEATDPFNLASIFHGWSPQL
ncbi:hypothetical protein BD779DRAFT_1512002 [Infundibulicybe gibba]|nr:hypothetical protein BD779DRAFT_1512002 [Infundibulicybe gibba]